MPTLGEIVKDNMDAERIKRNLLDPQKAILNCPVHGYTASHLTPPLVSGCRNCWMVYFCKSIAQLPKGQQLEKLEQLESAIHHSVEMEEAGLMDFDVFTSPQINIEKDSVN